MEIREERFGVLIRCYTWELHEIESPLSLLADGDAESLARDCLVPGSFGARRDDSMRRIPGGEALGLS